MSRAVNEDTTGRSRLEQLFFAAAALSAEEQEAFVEHECAGESETAAALRKLLRAERSNAHEWTAPVWSAAGLRFGPYRVTGHLGSGGMGVVYCAIRDDAEFQKRVAIKAIPPSLVTESGALALRQERQILAQLEHPNIARLLDGGATEYGVPYLVMEYVEGHPLLAYAEERGLNVPQRLKLFLAICDGVAYAHRNLVIHRDLKPSNILVTADGAPKLLDFGIARLLDQPRELTVLHSRRMTPDFASPEQVRGERMTTASDIYSLGVLLFVLLTGKPASSVNEARALPRGELGNIISMAMRPEPRDRYSSVEHFAEDIRRYLDGIPVAAHPPSFWYRARKFIRRRRIGLAAALAVMAALTFAAALEVRASRLAQRRFDDVRGLATYFVFEVPDTLKSVPGTLAARQSIIQRATGYLDSLARDAGQDLQLESELASAYDRIGSLTFDVQGALALHRKALAINRRLVAAKPANPKFLEQLSGSYGLVGDILRDAGDSTGALENYQASMKEIEPLRESRPAAVADAYTDMGVILAKLGRFDEALSYHSKAVAIRRELLRMDPSNPEVHGAWIPTQIWMARALLAAGKPTQALEYGNAALAKADSMASAEPANWVYRRERWVARMVRAAALHNLGDFAGAEAECRQSLGLIQWLAEIDPGDRGHRRGVAITWLGLADAQAALGRRAEAERSYTRAIAESEQLLREDPQKLETTIDLGRMYTHLASMYLKDGSAAKARAAGEKGRRLLDTAAAQDPHDALVQRERAEASTR